MLHCSYCGVRPGDIERALEPYAEVISIKDLYIRDFPEIKNGKQRVVLKPWESKLPSLFQVGRYKASLFFTGRVSCCPYCEQTDHLGKDCSRKHEEMLYVRQTWPFPEPGQLHWPERHGRYVAAAKTAARSLKNVPRDIVLTVSPSIYLMC